MHHIILHVHNILISKFDAGDVKALVAISHEPCRVSNKADKTAENYSQQTNLISSSREIGNRVRDDVLTGTRRRDLVLIAKLLFDFNNNQRSIMYTCSENKCNGKKSSSICIHNIYHIDIHFLITTGLRFSLLRFLQVDVYACKNQNIYLLNVFIYLLILCKNRQVFVIQKN